MYKFYNKGVILKMQNLDVRMVQFKTLIWIYVPRNTRPINSRSCLSLCNKDHIKRKESSLTLPPAVLWASESCHFPLCQHWYPVKSHWVCDSAGCTSILTIQRIIFVHQCLQEGHPLSPDTESNIYWQPSMCQARYYIPEYAEEQNTGE